MAQQQLEGAGGSKQSLSEFIWSVYVNLGRHAHSAEIWDICVGRGVDPEILAGLARQAGVRAVSECMKVKHPKYGVARCWPTGDGWQQLLLLTDLEMSGSIESDSKQVVNDLMELKKKRDVMFAFHGWAPEIPELAK
jgi:hypothetical protein